jgi:hypothetical protein
MASIQLSRDEAEEDDLPDVCMRCASPATVRKRYRFTSHPLWLYLLVPFGILPYVVAAAMLTERARCYTHLCPRHANHWRVRAFVVWGGLATFIVAFGASIAVASAMPDRLGPAAISVLGWGICVGGPVFLTCWLVSILIVQLTAIHLSNVTDRRLTLVGVSPSFVEAVAAYREGRAAEDAEGSLRDKFRVRRDPHSGPEIYDPER